MSFKLNNDICFFDLETTGLNVMKDRIIQIGIIKYEKEGTKPIEFEMLINPGMPISKEAMEITGITAETVRNKPTFKDAAEEIFAFIGNSDLAGYNSNRFDVPILLEEFNRVGFDFDLEKRKLIDVQQIFYKMEPRTLSAALNYYCGKKMENAHDALVDVRATVDVLKGQLERYQGMNYVDKDGVEHIEPVRNDMEALSKFSTADGVVDVTQRLKYNSSGEIVFNFGKYKGHEVAKIFNEDKRYYHWIISKDFSVQVKRIVKKIYEENVKTN